MKKMLMISNMYPSSQYPSYGPFVKLFHEQANEFFDITLLCLHKQTSKVKKLCLYVVFYIKILFCILYKKYDVVYVHYISFVALPLLFCKKIKEFNLYVNVHGSDIIPNGKLKERLVHSTKKILSKTQKVIVPSSFFKKVLQDNYCVSQSIIYIYPSGGVNSNKFFIDESVKCNDFDLNDHYSYIGYASRLDKGKGFDLYLKAILYIRENNPSYLKNYKFLLIGSGDCKSIVDTFIKENQMEDIVIRFSGMEQEKLGKIYNVLRWFVFPSVLKESLGLVGLEALACGVPVIASDSAGAKTYIDDQENGLLFEPENLKSLATSIMKAIDLTDDDYLHMKTNAITSAEAYLDKNLKSKFHAIFE